MVVYGTKDLSSTRPGKGRTLISKRKKLRTRREKKKRWS